MPALTAEHMAMLRKICGQHPAPYEETFCRNDYCDSHEDIRLFLELGEAGMIWFKEYGGEFRMEGRWVITRAGAEAAMRRGPARAAEILSEPEPEPVAAKARGQR
jgi:hypothetical protein